MISSIIWLVLLEKGLIDAQNAPWKIYLPICLVEIIIYLRSLTKWGEK